MALRRPIKFHHFFPPKTFHHSHLIKYFLHTENTLNPQNTIPKSNPNFQSQTIHHSTVNVPTHLDRNEIVSKLITIFTKQPRNNEELRIYGDRLSNEIVEMVLKGFKSWRIAYDFFVWASEQDGYKHSCYTYNTMASILSLAKETSKLKVLAMDIVNSRCSMTPGALGFLIRCLGNQGLVEEAIYIFDQAEKLGLTGLNPYIYNCLLGALAKSNKVELVEMTLTEMRDLGWVPDKFTLTPVLQVYCNSGRFEEALGVFNQIFDKGWVDEHILTILVVSFSKWGEIDKAFELIERMEEMNKSLNEKTLCMLIHGFTKESRVDKALQLFDKMRKLGFSPDLKIYSVLIEGLCKKKELEKALELYTEMKDSGIFPDVEILMKLISSFCVEGDLVTAHKLLEDGEEGLELEARVLLYNAVLDGLVNNGMVEQAYLLLQAMMGVEGDGEAAIDNLFKIKKKVIPNTDSFKTVIDGLCKNGKLDLALRLFADMPRIGCQRNMLLYNNLINELCNSDRLEEGMELLREMKESGFKPTHFTHNCIFGCFCRRQDVLGALDIIRDMRSFGHEPWIKHSSTFVKQLCRKGKAIEACNFLKGMLEEGFLPDIIAYSAAIDGLFKFHEADQAMGLFRDIAARGYRPDLVAYNIIIRGLCKVGRVSEAQEFLSEMVEKGILPSVVTYNLMIDGFCKINEINQALVFLKRMVDETIEPTVITYTTLIAGLCNTGNHNEALVLWEEMEKKGCPRNSIAYMALIHGLCKCNKAHVALVYFREMEKKEMIPDIYVHVVLINGFISTGDFLLAFEIIQEMVQKGTFPGQSDKNYPLLIDALRKLSKDASTSSEVKNLLAKGCIPAIDDVIDNRIETGERP